jgi:S-adenosylmethionine hydrolase
MSTGLITLTTDFGTTDHFVAAMKGVILGIAPRARVIDVTHEIPPYNVTEASFIIAETWPYYPKGTIHVVVVDPGVGSARRPILVEAGGQFFLGPDNGVLSLIYRAGPHKVREISNIKLMRKEISRTFHGRDVFAPVAAHLTKGTRPALVGKLIKDYVHTWQMEPTKLGPKTWRATVLKVDRFGNLITNLDIKQFPQVKTHAFEVRCGTERIHRLALTYSETELGELSLIVGSSGYLEIAANQASAAAKLGCSAGASLELELD